MSVTNASHTTGDSKAFPGPYPCQRLKSQIMTLHRLDSVRSRKPSIPVHDKGHMFRDGTLAQGADEQRFEVGDGELDGRRGEEPVPES